MKPSAKVILDSVWENRRLTTIEATMHRFVLAELNTHRAFSRNSASSRAIPIEKQIARVQSNPAYPVFWGKNQKGMQSTIELDEEKKLLAKDFWDNAKSDAIDWAEALQSIKVHKQLTNRLLEPFMWHTVIITATEWDNFFHQRCHPDAQPEMKAVADAIQFAYYRSNPIEVESWHLPYVRSEDFNDIVKWAENPVIGGFPYVSNLDKYDLTIQACKWVSTARCARVSYLTHDGVRDIQEDINMFKTKLEYKGHWSPFEHIARPATTSEIATSMCGNFQGWFQFRKEYQNENRTKFIPNLPELQDIAKQLEVKYAK